MPGLDPTQRFSNRVEDYRRYRPYYPPHVLELIEREIGLVPQWVVADVGAGTGLSSKLFLQNGNRVIAVEPNAAMRAESIRLLGENPGFEAVDGRAEQTGLPNDSVDLVVAAQAFHWFQPEQARREFARVLRPPGHVVLLWNRRLLDGTPFLEAYEALLLQFGLDYDRVRHERVAPAQIAAFFGRTVRRHVLANEQRLDRDGLVGRVRSSSYVPAPDHASHAEMVAALDRLFETHAQNGSVCIAYAVEVYLGTLLT